MWFILTLAVFDVVVLAFVLAAGAHLLFSYRNAVPPVMTPRGAMPDVLAALDLPDEGRFYELGCGDGRVLAAVARQRPKLAMVGIDNNPIVLAMARLRMSGRAKLIKGEIMAVSLHDADRVFAYLGPFLMVELEDKLEREMPAGSRLVSQQFPLPNRTATQEIVIKQGEAHAARLYVYDY